MSLLKKNKMVPFFASNGNSEKVRAPYGIQPTTLCDLVGCSNHWATGNSMASKVERVRFFFFKRLTWWLDSWIYDMLLCDCMMQLWVIRALLLLYICSSSAKDSLGGWMVESTICLYVTAWCSYESYVLVLVWLCDCSWSSIQWLSG